ncbi:serine/arginine repetitive matrix protein 2 [Cydia amplana]|uniref:serine/arginine repetitive matrix protein 2 n=1 Tax=Cydia amplana TaxID=1869771 RepID=UPI002FE63E09
MEKESRERIRRGREARGTSPRAALRRVLLLAEGRQFREAAAVVARAGSGVLAPLAADLPLDLLADSLPHSAVLIELLLNRLVELDVSPRPSLPVEALAWRLAALLGGPAGAGEAARLAGAARALARYQPALPAAVDARRRQLDQAVHGLGTHGLTAAAGDGGDSELVSLHAALRDALAAHVEAYKQALHKVQELSAVTAVTAPAASSHQRLLALPAADVERRLIDNASLLAAVRRAPPTLAALAAALDARVAADKQVLACAGLVRRADPHNHKPPPANDTRPVAGVLMSYSRGCATLLSLMTDGKGPAPSGAQPEPGPEPEPAPEPPRSPPDSASDGYHSDSDHSHPAPDRYVLTRPVRVDSSGTEPGPGPEPEPAPEPPRSPPDSASDGYHSDSDHSHPAPDRYVLTRPVRVDSSGTEPGPGPEPEPAPEPPRSPPDSASDGYHSDSDHSHPAPDSPEPEPAPEPPRSPPDSASDGYHSDSDHSHPAPDRYVLTRPVRVDSSGTEPGPGPEPEPAPEPPRSPPDSASDGYHSDSDHSHPAPDRSSVVAGAVAAYGEAWAGAAARWLPALANLPCLRRAPALPHKIVFSVVVLSFRAAISLRDKRLAEVKALLGADDPPHPAQATAGEDSGSEGAGAGEEALARLTAAATRVLRAKAHVTPLHDAERTVVTQVASTLREYTGLAESSALRALTAACCRAAWRLVLAAPQLRLDTDFTATRFDPEKHVVWVAGAGRAAAAGGARGQPIRSFVWPALLDRQRVLFRAVVLV